jgi:hypothetical protein
MKGKAAYALLALVLVPALALGATTAADETIELSVSPADNVYLAGAEILVSAALPADLLGVAGSLVVRAPIAGDALVAGGTVELSGKVGGDVRAAGGRILIEEDVAGDVALAGGAVTMTGKGNETRIAGGTVELRGGAAGPVTVYGGTIFLSGEFAGDVQVVASDHVTLGDGTVIRGALEYNAPQEAGIPASAVIEGGVRYTGSSAFLPTAEEAQTFALAGLGVFFLVRLLASALAAGLLAGLFPLFVRLVAGEAVMHSPARFALLALLGLALLVGVPILLVFLVASFVGIGIAALLGAAYLLALLVSYLLAAIMAGALVMRLLFKRWSVSWKAALLGMLVLYLLGLVPVFGALVSFIFSLCALGALCVVCFRFASRSAHGSIA